MEFISEDECARFENKMKEQKIKEILGPKPPRPSTECPVCFGGYGYQVGNKPRMIECGHTMCESCIDTTLKHAGNDRIFCPTCRSACMIFNSMDLPVNFLAFDS